MVLSNFSFGVPYLVLFAHCIVVTSGYHLAVYHPPSDPGHLPHRYMIQLRHHHSLEAHFERIGVDLSKLTSGFTYLDSINLYAADLNHSQVHDLVRKDPDVEYVTHDFESRIDFGNNRSTLFEEQHVNAKFSRAYELANSLRASPYYVAMTADKFDHQVPPTSYVNRLKDAGKGVDVYVVDTGIQIRHPAFTGRDVRHFRNQALSPYVSPPEDPTDEEGHGTSVAGVVAEIAPWATIIGVKVLTTTGIFSTTAILQAINDVIHDHNQNKMNPPPGWRGSVINLSLALLGDESATKAVLQAAVDAGIPFVTGAGNKGGEPTDFSCKWPGLTICVANCNDMYRLHTTSNRGPKVTIIAPGYKIKTPGIEDYVMETGTSFASPNVAGIVAIYVSWERITDDIAKVRDRLMENALSDVILELPPDTVNKLAQTGINNPEKDCNAPYKGAPVDRLADFPQPQTRRMRRRNGISEHVVRRGRRSR